MQKLNIYKSPDMFELYFLILTWNKKEYCREKEILKELNATRRKSKRKKLFQTTLNNQLKLLKKNQFIATRLEKLGDEHFGPYIHKQFKYYIINLETKHQLMRLLLKINYPKVQKELNQLLNKEKSEKENIWEQGLDAKYLETKQLVSFNLFRLFNFFLTNIVQQIQANEKLTFSQMQVRFEHFLLINWSPIHKSIKDKTSPDWLNLFETIFVKTEPYFKDFILTKEQLTNIRMEELK